MKSYKNKGILKFSLIFMYFWMMVDSWQTLNFTWSYCTWLVLSLHHMWLFKQVEQHLIWSISCSTDEAAWCYTTVRLPLRFSKRLLPVSGVISFWSSNSLLQTCTSLATTLGSAVLWAQVQNLVLGQLLLRVSIWVERALYMRNSCVTVVARKGFLCFRLLQNHNAALSSPFGEQKVYTGANLLLFLLENVSYYKWLLPAFSWKPIWTSLPYPLD